MHGNKECPFNGVTNSGRVWRKVAGKRGGRSVERPLSGVTNSGIGVWNADENALGVWNADENALGVWNA